MIRQIKPYWKHFDGKAALRHQYQPEKDYTDSEIAIGKAMERNSSEIHILGGTGTRLDHVLGNIQLLMQPLAKDIPCFLIDSHNRIRLLKERAVLRKSQQFGKYVSLLPLTTEPELIEVGNPDLWRQHSGCLSFIL